MDGDADADASKGGDDSLRWASAGIENESMLLYSSA